MLDGKRYYAVFPDESPELRSRIRAVLDALADLDEAFRQHLQMFQPDNSGPSQSNGTVSILGSIDTKSRTRVALIDKVLCCALPRREGA
jgi:hypothetical protein